jgi:hypothetical protein
MTAPWETHWRGRNKKKESGSERVVVGDERERAGEREKIKKVSCSVQKWSPIGVYRMQQSKVEEFIGSTSLAREFIVWLIEFAEIARTQIFFLVNCGCYLHGPLLPSHAVAVIEICCVYFNVLAKIIFRRFRDEVRKVRTERLTADEIEINSSAWDLLFLMAAKKWVFSLKFRYLNEIINQRSANPKKHQKSSQIAKSEIRRFAGQVNLDARRHSTEWGEHFIVATA